MQTESKQQILERRKEIEQELLEMLKETESDFTVSPHQKFWCGDTSSQAFKFGFTARQCFNWCKALTLGTNLPAGRQGSPQGQPSGIFGVTGSRTWPAILSSDLKPR